jgi:hypothetical protein
MVVFASWPWEWSASAWSALTFLVLLTAAVLAWRQVKEAARLRRERSRPFVLIDFHAWSTIIEIRITNIGATIAREVRFKFDPPLASTRDNQPPCPLRELNVFKHGIPSLAPGKEIKLFFDQFPARVGADLPMTYDVEVSYRDHAGEDYSEPIVLDLAMYVGTGGITRYGVHDIYKEIKAIADNVKRWTHFSGLKVLTRADLKEREAELDAFEAEQEKAAAAAAEGVTSAEASPNAALTGTTRHPGRRSAS